MVLNSNTVYLNILLILQNIKREEDIKHLRWLRGFTYSQLQILHATPNPFHATPNSLHATPNLFHATLNTIENGQRYVRSGQ